MKFLDLVATKFTINVKRNFITYETDVEAGPGIIVPADESSDKTMIITNQTHLGGKVVVTMKPFVSQMARRYEVGDVIAKLVVLE